MRGFTMIELLSVILIVAILGSIATTQFLDFRNETKLAALQNTLNTVRMGIKNQASNAVLRCGDPLDVKFSAQSIISNDVTTWGLNPYYSSCTAAELPNPIDRKFFDDTTILQTRSVQVISFSGVPSTTTETNLYNPFVEAEDDEFTYVVECQGAGCTNRCTAGCGNGTAASTPVSWCYNRQTNLIWAATNVMGECNY